MVRNLALTRIRKLLRKAEFEEVSFKLTPTGDMAVGLHRYLGEGSALPENQQLFMFSGTQNRATQPVFQTSGE